MSSLARLRPRAFVVALFGTLLVCGAFAPHAGADDTKQLVDAEDVRDLETLTRYLKDTKALSSQIIEYLNLVATAYVSPQAPVAVPAAAGKARPPAPMTVAKFRARALKQIVRALRLERVRNEVNRRDTVNRFAAKAITKLGEAHPGSEGEKAREAMARRVRERIEHWQEKARYKLDDKTRDAAFETLGSLTTPATLAWLHKEFTHTKAHEVVWLLAAHKTMLKFPVDAQAATKAGRMVVPGKVRHEVVDDFITTYAAVETAANTSRNDPGIQAAKRFWDDVKNTAIPVLQHFARQPRDPESGVGVASVAEFRRWFREHRNPKKAPWADPK